MPDIVDCIDDSSHQVTLSPSGCQDPDDLFEEVSLLYPDLRLEMDEAGNIILMVPGTIASSFGSSCFFEQLALWARKDGTGRAFDASLVYKLPSGAKRSPDASWVPKSVL